jgi:hypothetical protein
MKKNTTMMFSLHNNNIVVFVVKHTSSVRKCLRA